MVLLSLLLPGVRLSIIRLPDKDIDTLYRVIIKFIPEEKATEEETKAFLDAAKDRRINGTISHDAINWD